MDLVAVSIDLETAALAHGYSAFSYEPDDPGNLPAAVVGGIDSMVALNRFVTTVQLGVTFYQSLGLDDGKSARRALDKTFSVGTGTSFLDALAAQAAAGHFTAIKVDGWAFVSADRYTKYEMPGEAFGLGCTMHLAITG